MKKILSLVLASLMLLSLAACGSGTQNPPSNGGDDSSPTYNLKCSTYISDSDSLMPVIQSYMDSVAEKSGGKIKITLYPGEQLGGYEQTFEETMRGTIEFGFNAVPGTYDQRLESAFVPGAISTYDMLDQFCAPGSTVFNTYSEALDSLGIKLLGFFVGGYNNLCLNVEPPAGYADPTVAKDTVVRVPSGTAIVNDIVGAMGYRTAALPGVDVYSGLQTGVVDGTVGQSNTLVLSGYSDVVSYIVDTRMTASIDPIFINKELYESMPEEYQQILEDCASEFYQQNIQFLKDEEVSTEEQLKEKNIEVVHLSDEERALLDEKVMEAVWPTIEERYGADFLEGVKKDVGLS